MEVRWRTTIICSFYLCAGLLAKDFSYTIPMIPLSHLHFKEEEAEEN